MPKATSIRSHPCKDEKQPDSLFRNNSPITAHASGNLHHSGKLETCAVFPVSDYQQALLGLKRQYNQKLGSQLI